MTNILDHIVIYASDMANSQRFYEAVLPALGFEVLESNVFRQGELYIDLREAYREGERYDRGKPGTDHIGFRAHDRDQVYALDSKLETAGIADRKLIEFDTGDLALFVKDPDGLRIELTAYVDPDKPPVG